jgi:hypothetical protein
VTRTCCLDALFLQAPHLTSPHLTAKSLPTAKNLPANNHSCKPEISLQHYCSINKAFIIYLNNSTCAIEPTTIKQELTKTDFPNGLEGLLAELKVEIPDRFERAE